MARAATQPWQAFLNHPTRRQLLRIGGLAPLGLSLPQLLAARGPATRPDATSPRAKSCIFVVQYGGASQIDTWDPKPDAPADIRGPYRPIATSVAGTRMTELLPRLARLANCCCLIRSMTHGNGDHDGGMHVCMTGHSRPRESTPCFGSIVARLRPSGEQLRRIVFEWGKHKSRDERRSSAAW